MNYTFVSDTAEISLIINDQGKVSGTLGGASFQECSVSKNRNELEKKLNMATDLVIKGKLIGYIFSKDTISEKKISIPFNSENNSATGTIFQKEGLDLFPMADFNLIKK